jgi:hypothetical protein
MSSKKAYFAPELTVHGNVETITEKGGGSKTDVPQGTIGVINAITS